MMNKIGAIFCILLHIGCASTTLINSVPEGAKVTIDGEYAGTTPYSYTDSKILGSPTIIELKKDGYKTKSVTIQKTDKPKIGAIIGGFFYEKVAECSDLWSEMNATNKIKNKSLSDTILNHEWSGRAFVRSGHS
jgi:hypothetical protein